MATLHKEIGLHSEDHSEDHGPSHFVLAICWTKAVVMSAKQRWMLFRMFYLKR